MTTDRPARRSAKRENKKREEKDENPVEEICERCLKTVKVSPEYRFDTKRRVGKFVCPACSKIMEYEPLKAWR